MLERVNGAMDYFHPGYFINNFFLAIKNDDHNSMGLLNGRLDWQWKGFGSSKSDDPESNTLNSGSLKRSVLKTSLFLSFTKR